jgi:adenylyl-sulfate kinase
MRDSHPANHEIGAIVWFTGLPRAGKSTLAYAVAQVASATHPVEVLDGDAVRAALSPGLGFSRPERDAHVRRLGYMARLLARHGVLVIVAAISPYGDTREEVRQLAAASSIPFVQIFVTAPLESLIARDTSGLYARALAGELPQFTGVSDPYEAPVQADLVVQTDAATVEACVERVVQMLIARGVLRG